MTATAPASLVALLCDAVATTRRIPRHSIDASRPLADLGIDSIQWFELHEHVESRVGRPLPMDAWWRGATLNDIARSFEHESEPSTSNAIVSPTTLARIQSDATHLEVGHATVDFGDAALPHAVLLTGATGFLGSHVLQVLVEAGHEVHALVRADSPAHGRQRIRSTAARYGLPGRGNFRVWPHDLRTHQPAGWWDLLHDGAGVVHVAAQVNWVLPYEALRESNVLATERLLRLALDGKPSPFVFVSSLSVAYSEAHVSSPFAECDNPLEHIEHVPLGYAQSKIAAEALVRSAARRGLPCAIHRPGLLRPSAGNGRAAPDDLLMTLLRGCTALESAPDFSLELGLASVESTARAVVATPLRSEAPTVHHTVDRRDGTWRELVVAARLRGHRLDLLPADEWSRHAHERTSDTRHPLHALRPFATATQRTLNHRTVCQWFESASRRPVSHDASRARRAPVSSHPDAWCRAIDRAERDKALPRARQLPPPPRAVKRLGDLIPDGLWPDADLDRTVTSVGDAGLLSTLAGWSGGSPCGLYRVAGPRPAIVKRHASDASTERVAVELARVAAPSAAAEVARWFPRLEACGSGPREVRAVRAPAIARCAPEIYASASASDGSATLIMAELDAATWCDHGPEVWPMNPPPRDSVVRDLAALHAASWSESSGVGPTSSSQHRPWSPDELDEMSGLWSSLAETSARVFSHLDPGPWSALLQELVADGPQRRAVLLQHPHAQIHGDASPRNWRVHHRTRALCAFDWELTTWDLPQRDLVEILLFALESGQHGSEDVIQWVTSSRNALASALARPLDDTRWWWGLQGTLEEWLVTRAPFLALIAHVRPLPWLPRVLRAWRLVWETCQSNTSPQSR